ncbi:PRRT1 [Branchiostoma lanceolatum]|uniref:PRRT1 protein n=1 Tax=Branchiostoma lanceolatum TaxID=7740 RepID=A0A8K0A5D0_BRALA|nr:PRRT1 [Branchiostoma lanceolatum]
MEMHPPNVVHPAHMQQTVVQTAPPTQIVIAEGRPQDHFGCALFTCICCFWPTGIVALVFSCQVSQKLNDGDIAGARDSSSSANLWWKITLGIGIALWIIGVILIPVYFLVILPLAWVGSLGI